MQEAKRSNGRKYQSAVRKAERLAPVKIALHIYEWYGGCRVGKKRSLTNIRQEKGFKATRGFQ